MFTGIVQAVGQIVSSMPREGDLRLRIATAGLDLADVALGDSIATNGVCLTVVELPGDGFWADVSLETLQYSTLKSVKPGQTVNLEKALMASSRLGGHIVSGHVDGVGQVIARSDDARSVRFSIEAPAALAKYIVVKGAVFELNIVPHTVQETIIANYQPGSRVNLEVDVIARYLERLLLGDKAADSDGSAGLSMAFLAEHGFR